MASITAGNTDPILTHATRPSFSWVHKRGDHGVLVLLEKYEWSAGPNGRGQVHVRIPLESGGYRLALLVKDCGTAADAERKLVASGVLPDLATPICGYRWLAADGELRVCGNRARAGRYRVTDRLTYRHQTQGPALGPEINLCHACARACAIHNETGARVGDAV